MIPAGVCQCGCGRPTRIAQKTCRRLGHVRGEPTPFLKGHKPLNTDPEYVAVPGPFASPCWLWARALNSKGYGLKCLRDGTGGTTLAHRWYWEDANGQPVPRGMQLHHCCEERRCVNPDHLVPVTPRQHRRLRRAA